MCPCSTSGGHVRAPLVLQVCAPRGGLVGTVGGDVACAGPIPLPPFPPGGFWPLTTGACPIDMVRVHVATISVSVYHSIGVEFRGVSREAFLQLLACGGFGRAGGMLPETMLRNEDFSAQPSPSLHWRRHLCFPALPPCKMGLPRRRRCCAVTLLHLRLCVCVCVCACCCVGLVSRCVSSYG